MDDPTCERHLRIAISEDSGAIKGKPGENGGSPCVENIASAFHCRKLKRQRAQSVGSGLGWRARFVAAPRLEIFNLAAPKTTISTALITRPHIPAAHRRAVTQDELLLQDSSA